MPGGAKSTPHWPVIIIAVFKAGLLGFTLTLGVWTVDKAILTVSGCCVVLALSATRILNYVFIHQKEVIQQFSDTVRRATTRATGVLPPVVGDSAAITLRFILL